MHLWHLLNEKKMEEMRIIFLMKLLHRHLM